MYVNTIRPFWPASLPSMSRSCRTQSAKSRWADWRKPRYCHYWWSSRVGLSQTAPSLSMKSGTIIDFTLSRCSPRLSRSNIRQMNSSLQAKFSWISYSQWRCMSRSIATSHRPSASTKYPIHAAFSPISLNRQSQPARSQAPLLT